MINPMANFYANIYNTIYKSYLLNTKQFLNSLSPIPSYSSLLASQNEKPFLKQKQYQTIKKVNMKEVLSYV